MMSDPTSPVPANVDADEVIKGFGEASETTLLFSDMLKLCVAAQRNGVVNPYTDVDDDEAMQMCLHPERLNEQLQKFILWQQNILKLDVIEISKTEMPKGFKSKYDVKGSRLAELSSDEERKAAIQVFMDEQERYFAKFNEVRAILEATEDRFITIEDVLLRAESMDDGIASHIQAEKSKIEDIRKQLCDMRAILEDTVLPDLISFDKAPENARALMVQLSDINITLRENIRRHQLSNE